MQDVCTELLNVDIPKHSPVVVAVDILEQSIPGRGARRGPRRNGRRAKGRGSSGDQEVSVNGSSSCWWRTNPPYGERSGVWVFVPCWWRTSKNISPAMGIILHGGVVLFHKPLRRDISPEMEL